MLPKLITQGTNDLIESTCYWVTDYSMRPLQQLHCKAVIQQG